MGSWKAAAERGLGDRKTRTFGVLLIFLAVIGKLFFLRYTPNVETIFVASLMAGSLLGRWWTVLVPLVSMAIIEPVLWGTDYAGYALLVTLGLTFFMVTGFLFVGVLGRGLKPRVLFRVKSVALLTTISVPMTIAYDLWTDVGQYYFIARPQGLTFWDVLGLQAPFTAMHLLSSLIFVPLFGSGLLYLHAVAWPQKAEAPAPADPSRDE